jgi:hypothetical protein
MSTMHDLHPITDIAAGRARRAGAEDEFAEAARLIHDLKRLVDAGLVVIDEPFFGPARYRAVYDALDAA